MLEHNHPWRRRFAPRPNRKDASHPQPLHFLLIQHPTLQPHFPRHLLRHLRQRRRVDVISGPPRNRPCEVLPLCNHHRPIQRRLRFFAPTHQRHPKPFGPLVLFTLLTANRPFVFLIAKARQQHPRRNRVHHLPRPNLLHFRQHHRRPSHPRLAQRPGQCPRRRTQPLSIELPL